MPWLLPLVPLCLVALIAAAHASIKPFWYDELATLLPAGLPTFMDCWNFYAEGLDTPSPLPALLVHAVMKAQGPAEIMKRIPMMLGFLVMCLSLYGFTSRRYGRSYGVVALLLPVLTGVFYYATELRAYPIVLGAVAFALWCWQSAQEKRTAWLCQSGVFIGLAAAMGSHIFAIFVIPAFVLGQWIHERLTRARHPGMWVAILLSPCSLLPQWEGMHRAHEFYGPVFWSKPVIGHLLHSYDFTFAFGWFIPFVTVVAFGFLLARLDLLPLTPRDGASARGFRPEEWSIAWMLALVPFLALPVSCLIGAYCPRYVLTANIGIFLLLVGGTAEALRGNRILGAILASLLTASILALNLKTISKALACGSNLPAAIASREDWLGILEARKGEPVIVPDAFLFLVINHYGSPELKKRLYYLTDAGCCTRQKTNDDVNIRLFSRRLPLQTVDYPSFHENHQGSLVTVYHYMEEKTAKELGLRPVGHYRSRYLDNNAPRHVSVYESTRGADSWPEG